MKPKKRAWSRVILASVAVVGAIVASAAPGARGGEGDATPASCCVANPRFAGMCAVELGRDETSQDVLAYLNNAASVGKTYCGNTEIRMGWQQVECQEEE